MKLSTLIATALCLTISTAAQTAAGGWTLGPNWTYNRNISNQELARIAMQGEINKRLLRVANSRTTKKRRVRASGPTSFSSGDYLLPELISAQAEGSAEEKRQIKTALENSIKFYENIALVKEYPANDLSFAMLYYVINNYVIYRNIDPAATDISGQTQYLVGGFYSPLYSHEKAVYDQLRKQLSASGDLTSMKDEDKRKTAEMLAIYTTLMWHRFQELSKSRDMNGLGQIRALAQSNVESFVGAQIEMIEVGTKGIVIKR